MKIVAVENVYLEGRNYRKGQTYDVSPSIAYALNSSVKILEEQKVIEPVTADMQAPVNTMMSKAKTRTKRAKRNKKV